MIQFFPRKISDYVLGLIWTICLTAYQHFMGYLTLNIMFHYVSLLLRDYILLDTKADLRVIDFVPSPVWWEAATNV